MRKRTSKLIRGITLRAFSFVCIVAISALVDFRICHNGPLVGLFESADFVRSAEAAENDDSAINEKLVIAQTELAAAEKQLRFLNNGLGYRGLVATPLDLTKFYHRKAETFDKETRYPSWKIVPRGAHTFCDIPFQIGGMITLWGERNANQGQNFRTTTNDIEVKRIFSTLFLYHATFFESKDSDPVYEVVFQFSDGTHENVIVRYADDVRDWYDRFGAPTLPFGPRSHLAWHGECIQNEQVQPLRFCLTAIQNPKPNLEVKSIDLISSQSTSAGCIMAMTTAVPSRPHADSLPEAAQSNPSDLKTKLDVTIQQRDATRRLIAIASDQIIKIQQALIPVGAAATPLDLTSVYTTPAEAFEGPKLFAHFKDLIWGSHTFLDVPVKIGGMFVMRGTDVANNGLTMSDRVLGIPVKRTFESLYIYHTTVSEADESESLYTVIFHYKNGTRESDQILFADDVRSGLVSRSQSSISAVPLGLRSKLAWHCNSEAVGDDARDLRCYLTELENPKPHQEVESIDFVSSESGPAGIVMGLTVGKAKLIP